MFNIFKTTIKWDAIPPKWDSISSCRYREIAGYNSKMVGYDFERFMRKNIYNWKEKEDEVTARIQKR